METNARVCATTSLSPSALEALRGRLPSSQSCASSVSDDVSSDTCGPGYRLSSGSCISCTAGQYSTSRRRSSASYCNSCPSGQTSSSGSDSSSDCYAVSGGVSSDSFGVSSRNVSSASNSRRRSATADLRPTRPQPQGIRKPGPLFLLIGGLLVLAIIFSRDIYKFLQGFGGSADDGAVVVSSTVVENPMIHACAVDDGAVVVNAVAVDDEELSQ